MSCKISFTWINVQYLFWFVCWSVAKVSINSDAVALTNYIPSPFEGLVWGKKGGNSDHLS